MRRALSAYRGQRLSTNQLEAFGEHEKIDGGSKERERENVREAVGGEGQGSATLSLINRATVRDYVE